MACNLSPNDKAIIQELNKLKYDINKIFGSDQDLCKGIFEVDKAKEKEFQDKNGEEYKITENERVKTPEKQNKKDKQRERQKKNTLCLKVLYYCQLLPSSWNSLHLNLSVRPTRKGLLPLTFVGLVSHANIVSGKPPGTLLFE